MTKLVGLSAWNSHFSSINNGLTQVKRLTCVSEILPYIAFVSVNDPDQVLFWELKKKTVDEFDLSPDGKEVVGITVTRHWIGGNKLLVLDVPKEYQIRP